MSRDLLIKQLLYRSNHRGCKETDILLGKFFNEYYSKFNDAELAIYKQFIEEDDVFIYDWIMGRLKVEKDYLDLVSRIREFHHI